MNIFKSIQKKLFPESKDYESCKKELENYNSFSAIEKNYLPKLPTTLSFTELEDIITYILARADDFNLSTRLTSIKILEALPEAFHENFDLSTIFFPEVNSYFLVTHSKEFTPDDAFRAMQFYAEEADFNIKNPSLYFPSDILSTQLWAWIIDRNPKIIEYIPEDIKDHLSIALAPSIENNHPFKDYESCKKELEKYYEATFTTVEKHYLPCLPQALTQDELGKIIKVAGCIPEDGCNQNYLTEGMKSLRMLEALPESFHKNFDLSKIFPSEVYSYFLVTHSKEFTPDDAFRAMQFYTEERFKTTFELHEANWAINNRMVKIEINPSLRNPSENFLHNTLSLQQWDKIIKLNRKMIDHIPQEIKGELDFHQKQIHTDTQKKKHDYLCVQRCQESKSQKRGKKI